MIAMKRILVPTDFSESSETAVRYGVAFAQAFNARLDLLHVVPRQDLEKLLEGERVVHVLTDSADAQASVEPDALMHEAERQMLATLLAEQEQKELRTPDGFPDVPSSERDISSSGIDTRSLAGSSDSAVRQTTCSVSRNLPTPAASLPIAIPPQSPLFAPP
jgi:nucleotide-binding universal stress UspA family protein